MSSRIRCGMFSWPSGANVSWSRAPPPKVTTTTFLLDGESAARAHGERSSVLPSVNPAALLKKSRRVRARRWLVRCGLDALRGAVTAWPPRFCGPPIIIYPLRDAALNDDTDIQLDDLRRNKQASGRLKDRVDLEKLP